MITVGYIRRLATLYSHAIIEESTTPKTQGKQGFGENTIWFNDQSFCRFRQTNLSLKT
jgi:hypothetical protein